MDPILENFTGKNIEDTYQKVLHLSDDGYLVNGTGSFVDLKISGSLQATSSYALTASYAMNVQSAGSYFPTGW